MKVKKITCPYCKAPITKISIDLGKVTCEYCGSTFIIQKENETHLEKFFRVWHEEDKRREEYDNLNKNNNEIKHNKILNILMPYLILIIIVIILLIIGKVIDLI